MSKESIQEHVYDYADEPSLEQRVAAARVEFEEVGDPVLARRLFALMEQLDASSPKEIEG